MQPTDSAEFLEGEWRAMQRRMLSHMKAGAAGRSSDLADATASIEAAVYTDAARFEAERQRLFREQPLLAGFSGDVPEPGDRLIFDAAGPPIVIVRGSDGVVRGFLNLCPHRGSRLVEECARSRHLACPFHGWSFDLEGNFVGAPQPESFAGLDLDARRLVRVPTAEWRGMIFVRATAGEEALDVESFLGPIGPLLEALDFGAMQPVGKDTLPVASNWKIALDTFCETYHVPALHRESLALNLVPYVAIYDHYGIHHRYSGPGRDFEALLELPESEWPAMSYQAVHYLFPNTTIAFTHAFDGATPVVSMFRLFPGETVGETITLATTYRRADAPAASDGEVAEMHAMVLALVGNEDYRVAAQSWQSLRNAPRGFRCVFGRGEPLLHHYHRDIARAAGMPLDIDGGN